MILYIENAKYSTKKTIRNNKQIGRVQNQYEKKSKNFKSRSLTLHSDLVTLVTNREEQRSKSIHWRMDSFIFNKCCWKNWTATHTHTHTHTHTQLDNYLTQQTNMILSPEAIKTPRRKYRQFILWHVLSISFWIFVPRHEKQKQKMN